MSCAFFETKLDRMARSVPACLHAGHFYVQIVDQTTPALCTRRCYWKQRAPVRVKLLIPAAPRKESFHFDLKNEANGNRMRYNLNKCEG